MLFDPSTDFGSRVARRVEQDYIGWLVTVDREGMPQPSPIWFLWRDEAFFIYSRPDAPKVRNINAHPAVALHLDGDGRGGDIVVFTGHAALVTANAAELDPAYLGKYRSGIASIGLTPETMAQEYSGLIKLTPTKLRGHGWKTKEPGNQRTKEQTCSLVPWFFGSSLLCP
ncbi:TIGR03667 family PPOX class F420-dependent oxidoreductase [Candidatus Gracilibacteria bacterium]|nr:TIGR03667 family PPOX class F420-dependent oxidoreductase [Candidatus Gracilibacteria bacterium]